jgi:outer membrane receptor for Fe3+-dicitrate
VIAQTTDSSGGEAFERLTVIGTRPAALTGGSANYLTTERLEQFRHTDVHRVLKQVPGLYVVEEDGYGLRPNIGLRGSGTDRNSRITVTEDGVLIAPAQYAAPAAYYFPTMQRMSAVEVRKGSAAVRSGPRTTGGAINLISAPIPDDPFGGRVSLHAGEDQTLLGDVTIGGTNGQWGYLVEALRQDTDGFKTIDGGGDSGYTLDDYLAKLKFTTASGARFHGMTAVVDAARRVQGIFTDGDLRRALKKVGGLKAARIAQVMTRGPRTIAPEALATEAVALMERHRISQLLVVNAAGELVGALNMNDLLRAKVV